MFIKKILVVFAAMLVAPLAFAEEFTAKSWVVADEYGQILDSEQENRVRSIASITKLMTVLVVLDQNPDLTQQVIIKHGLAPPSRRIPKRQRHMAMGDLVRLAMVSSDNLAAASLCSAYVVNGKNKTKKHSCVSAMNAKAHSLGMARTKFVEPTGLSEKNVSTAEDLVKLVMAAAKYIPVVDASHIQFGEIRLNGLLIEFKNTNALVGDYSDILVSKTGWTRAAGGCIAMSVGIAEETRIIIVLGSKSVRTRISEAAALIQKNRLGNKDLRSLQETNINTDDNRDLQ